MVLEPGGGLSFPLPPGSGSTASGGSLLAPARLFQRATPVFPFHLTGWPPHHPVLGQVQSQVQQTMQAQHQAAAAAVRFLSHHHPHHPHPALGNHPLVPTITGHHPAAHHLHHNTDHGDEDDEKKAIVHNQRIPATYVRIWQGNIIVFFERKRTKKSPLERRIKKWSIGSVVTRSIIRSFLTSPWDRLQA
uniref:Uncharacterized protein n=1 Tax=Vespula pensylvanica TaxID=30213 RepID=A0A834P565_VESPE|nr:hypothetical protein H0235_005640 [Vespula pensylvanica]